MRTHVYLIFFFAAALGALLLPSAGWAATAALRIDTHGVEINALEGRVTVPADFFLQEIQTGDSAILFWVERPHAQEQTISFAGITPGGFSGTHTVFIIHGVFDPKRLSEVRVDSVAALQNDGMGTQTPVTLSLSPISFRADVEPPETFVPTVIADPQLLDGQQVLVFASQDKGSGIARYEVREGWWGWFHAAESPYVLRDQTLRKDVYVKAIDFDGNERVVRLPARVHRPWWEFTGFFGILLVFVVAVFFLRPTWRTSIKSFFRSRSSR